MPTLHIVEPRLFNAEGHYASYTRGLSRTAAARGYRTVVWADEHVSDDAADLLPSDGGEVRAVFTHRRPVWPKLAATRWLRDGYVLGNVVAGLIEARAPQDIVFTFTGEAEYLHGAAPRLLASSPRRPWILQPFQWSLPRRMGLSDQPLRILRRATRPISRALRHNGSVAICGQSAPVANHIRSSIGGDVTPLTIPVAWDGLPAPVTRDSSPGDRPVVGFIGQPRAEKGISMFAAATPEVTCFADARYALIGGTGTDPDELRAMISDLAGQPGVAAYDFKDPSRFMEELAGFDIVALPYDEASYAHRPSTILIEACGLGVVPVVTPNTWLADFCREHSVGVVAEASTPQALVDAVRCATDDLTEMKRDLAERNHAWRQEFSVERLFDQLVEISAEH